MAGRASKNCLVLNCWVNKRHAKCIKSMSLTAWPLSNVPFCCSSSDTCCIEEENQSADIISMGSDGRQQQWYISVKRPRKNIRVSALRKVFTLAMEAVWEGGYGEHRERWYGCMTRNMCAKRFRYGKCHYCRWFLLLIDFILEFAHTQKIC